MCQFLLSAEHCLNIPVPQTDKINTIKINLKRRYRSAVSTFRISNIPIGDGSVDTHTSATDCLHSTQLNSTQLNSTQLCCTLLCDTFLHYTVVYYNAHSYNMPSLPFPSLLFPSLPFSSLPFSSLSFLSYPILFFATIPVTYLQYRVRLPRVSNLSRAEESCSAEHGKSMPTRVRTYVVRELTPRRVGGEGGGRRDNQK